MTSLKFVITIFDSVIVVGRGQKQHARHCGVVRRFDAEADESVPAFCRGDAGAVPPVDVLLGSVDGSAVGCGDAGLRALPSYGSGVQNGEGSSYAGDGDSASNVVLYHFVPVRVLGTNGVLCSEPVEASLQIDSAGHHGTNENGVPDNVQNRNMGRATGREEGACYTIMGVRASGHH